MMGKISSGKVDVMKEWFDAVKHDDVEKIKVMALAGTDVDLKHKWRDDHTALDMAAGEGQVEMVKTLISLKANVNSRAYSGQTPLYMVTGSFKRTPATWISFFFFFFFFFLIVDLFPEVNPPFGKQIVYALSLRRNNLSQTVFGGHFKQIQGQNAGYLQASSGSQCRSQSQGHNFWQARGSRLVQF